MKDTGQNRTQNQTFRVSEITLEWDLGQGACTFEKLPVAMMWVDSTLTGLMSGVQAMVGTERFILALQGEGRKSVEADWQVISAFGDFHQGFEAIAKIAAVAGWGRWRLLSLNEEKKEARFQVTGGWEGRYQKGLGVCWGSGMLAGKMAGYCSKLFGTNCWADQTAFLAAGDPYDEFLLKPSPRSIEKEVENLLATDEATRADMAVTLHRLEREIIERTRVEAALRRREEQYRAIFENALEGFFQSTPDGRFIRVNRALAEMCGFDSPEEMVSGIQDIAGQHYVHPEDREVFVRLLRERGKVEHFEHETYRKDGSTFWTSVSARTVRDENNRILYYEGTHENIDQRKKAERLLADAEEQYRTLFETSTNAILIRNREGVITMANGAAVALLGAKKTEDLIGRTYLELVHSEDGALSSERVQKIFEIALDPRNTSGKGRRPILPREHRMVRLDGEIIHVESTGVAFHHKGGLFIQGIFRDITTRKRAEEALRENEEKTRRLAEENATMAEIGRIVSSTLEIEEVYELFAREVKKLIPFDRIVISLIDLQGNKAVATYVSGREVPDRRVNTPISIDGTGMAEMVRTRASFLIQVEDVRVLQDRFPKLVSTVQAGFRSIMDVPLFSKGQIIGALLFRSSQPKAYTVKDVKLAERVGLQIAGTIANSQLFIARRQLEERYRSLVSNATDMIFIAQDGFLKFPNPATMAVTGYSEEELATVPFANFVYPEDREMVVERNTRRLKGEAVPNTYSFRILTKEGEELWVQLNSGLIPWEGRPGVLCSLRDITPQKRLEAQYLHAQKMEAIGTLAGGIAHDFNNLLQAVQGYAEILLMDKKGDDPSYRPLTAIQQAAHRGAELTRQLLTFSRKVQSRQKPLNLNQEIVQVEKLLQRTIPKMIQVELRLAGDLWTINADPVQVGQVLMNLAVNARDAMPEGGNLVIGTENLTLHEAFCRKHMGSKPGKHVLLTLSDTGQGMEKGVLDHLFEPFFTTKGMGQGTGLGLAMVYGIVKGHEGFIQCESELGKGTLFRIYWPAIEQEAEGAREEIQQPLRGGTETILLVDDEDALQELAKTILSTYGYRVIPASSGEKAIELYRREKERVHLVVLDLIMPGMGGLKCLEELRAIDPAVRIVIASGYYPDESVKIRLEREAKGFIHKPYHVQELLLAVRKALET